MKTINRYEVEDSEEWRKWCEEIPELKFPTGWRVKIIPPFGGAIARFRVFKGKKDVSVYLDCYDRLGCFGEPYWEIYPYEEDVHRVPMKNVDELISAITESLKR
jgi:hypothetical protein